MLDEFLKYEKKFDEYIMVAPGSDYGKVMWSDINLLNDCKVLDSPICNNNKLLDFLHHIHFSFRINNLFQLPFQRIWKKYYSLEEIKIDPKKKYCIIFTDISCCRIDTLFLKKLSNMKNVKLILIMVNVYVCKKKILDKRVDLFDLIFTFDKNDAKNNDFLYQPYNYSKVDIPNCEIINDCFFVGNNKGRLEQLERIYETIKDSNGKAEFYISGVKKEDVKENGIHYNKWLNYFDVLKKIQSTNCIIDLVSKNQEGLTLRTMEAICYNKKLITNNQNIKNISFYKTGYIKLIANDDLIDIDFINKRVDVNYNYNGEFSPINLIDRINNLIVLDK